MRLRVSFSFFIVLMFLTASYFTLLTLPFSTDLGLTMNASAAPPFSGGNGTAGNPFKISNVTQLQNMSANLSAQYILINDIDASETVSWNSGAGFAPIGNWPNTFNGNFNGNGFKISNLYINRPTTDDVGLFGAVSGVSKVLNVIMIDVSITGNDYVGALIGRGFGGKITNCSTNGTVLATNDYAGGLGGQSRTADNCTSSCTVTGGWYVGGLIGSLLMNEIENCYATGIVTGTQYVGGFVGASSATITNCYSTGKVTGTQYVGGFIGNNQNAQNCFWDTESSGTNTGIGSGNTGGVTGKTNSEMKTKSTFTNAGWDFNNVWSIFESISSPYLSPMGLSRGSGTKFYPFVIDDVFDLQAMNDYLYAEYLVVNDIDAIDTYNWNWDGNRYQGFRPIAPDTDPGTAGFQGTMFKGKFNGNGKTIYNLYINRPNEDYIGLFGVYNQVPGPFNISLIDCNVTGNNSVGGLIGISYIGTTVDKCYITGIIRGNWNVGGMVGYCRYHIKNSNSNCIVIGNSRAGGLVGYLLRAVASPIIMNNCYTAGTVTGEDYIGGLIGYASDPYFIRRCYSICDVTAEGATPQNAGGLIGYHAIGVVEDCYATGSVTGDTYVGGLLGRNFNGVVLNCSSSGLVNGKTTYGGFIGYNQTGGFGIIERCFFDTQTSGTSNGFGFGSSTEVVGQTTTQMMTQSTFTSAGWDFNNVWYMSNYGSRPFLRMEHNTTIRTDHQLQLIGIDPSASYTLANDIDLSAIIEPSQMWGTSGSSGPGFAPVTSTSNMFTGTFEGNGHRISNLYINRTAQSYIGLFGRTSSCELKNIVLENFNLRGAGYTGSLVGSNLNGGSIENITGYGKVTTTISYAGGLAGYSTSKIKNCSSYGSVNGFSSVGGLVGRSDSPGDISRSFSRAKVTGTSLYCGGLVGLNWGTISDSYTFSNVKGNNEVGGLVGESTNSIIGCYSIGNVTGNSNVGGLVGDNLATVTNSYWDIETSGKDYSDGGLGKTSDEMMQKSTYSGWDFNDAWGIIDGFSFPYLKWQYPEPPQAVSGIAYSDFSNNIGLGKTVDLVHMGKHVKIETTYSNGFYYFLMENNTFTSNDGMIVRFVNESIEGNTVFLANNSDNMKGLETYNNTLTVISGSGAIMNYTILEQARGSLTTGIVYRAFGAKLNLLTTNFVLDKDTTFELDGNFTATIISDSYFYGKIVLKTDISFEGAYFYFYKINGAYSMNIDQFAYFNKNVGDTSKPRSITVTIDTFFNCNFINTSGTQKYSQMGFLMKNLTLSTGSGAGDIIFEDVLDSIGTPFNLEMDVGTGDILFNDTVGGDIVTMGDVVVNSVHDLTCNADFHAQSFTQNAGTGTTNLGQTSLDLGMGPAIFKGNNIVGNITAGSLSLKVKTANLTGSINGKTGQAGADEIVLLNVIKKGAQFFDGFDLYPFDISYGTIATEDSLYSVNYKTEYPFYAGYSWSMDTNAGAWLTFDAGTAVLSGTPTNGDVGTHWVNVTVDDGDGGMDWHHFNLIVENVPTLITTLNPPISTLEDELYSYNFNCDDAASGIITWYLETNAGWLILNSINGVLSGTPGNDEVGDWWANVTVNDGNGGFDWMNFTITVINVNDPPEIQNIEIPDALEDTFYYLNFNAVDIDPTNDVKTWSLNSNADWLNINKTTGVLSGTPENSDVGLFWVNVSVNDGNGGFDWMNFTLTVLNVNDPPKIETDIVDTATASNLYSVDYEASDIDPTNDIFTWSLSTNATWLSIEASTGILSGTPTDDDVGIYWVNVRVSDGHGGFDWQNFTIQVQKSSIINNNPVITTQNVITVNVGEDYEVIYGATDDRTPADKLIWSMNSNASWLEFDNSIRILSGTPQEKDIGNYWVKIIVSDGEGGSAFTNFTLTVKKLDKPTNKNPVLTNGKMTPSSGNTETKFTFSVIYTDADNDPGEVYVWVDGEQQKMTPDPNDTDYTDGVEYTFETKLSKGKHKYYFTASDGTNAAISGDNTPMTEGEAVTTSEIEDEGDEGEKGEAGSDWLMLLLLVMIIIIIILLLISVFGRRKRGAEVEPTVAIVEEEADEPLAKEELEDEELEDVEDVEEPEFDEELEDDKEEPSEDAEVEDEEEDNDEVK